LQFVTANWGVKMKFFLARGHIIFKWKKR
jgi:hypothetical protein